MSGRLLTIRAITPIHTGTGQGTGLIDLPVAREVHTGWPVLEASGLKGALRDACGELGLQFKDNPQHIYFRIFGPPTSNAPDYAGALLPTNGILLCFPIRSFAGTFAWVTCPLALARWEEDRALLGFGPVAKLPAASGEQILLAQGTKLIHGGKVYLEELRLDPTTGGPSDPATAYAKAISELLFPTNADWQTRFRERFAVVGDDLFACLVRLHTIQAARIRLHPENKTVDSGALWYEEAIPAETVFAAPWRVSDRREGIDPQKAWEFVEGRLTTPVQFGGNKSVGRGLARIGFAAPPAAEGARA